MTMIPASYPSENIEMRRLQIQAKAQELLGAQLAVLTTPMFKEIYESSLCGSGHQGPLLSHMLSQWMGQALAEDPGFDGVVNELTEEILKKDEKAFL